MDFNNRTVASLVRGWGSNTRYVRKVLNRAWTYPYAWLVRRWCRSTVVVGITGSAGKTTVKNLALAILIRDGAAIGSTRSENERFPLAQVVATMKRYHQYCVVELSEHKPGALDVMIMVCKPDVAVLTNVNRDHFSTFKSLDAIADEVRKLVNRLPTGGVAVLNRDDPYVKEIGRQATCRIVWVGEDDASNIRLTSVESVWPEPLTLEVQIAEERHRIRTKLHGVHLAQNVAMALGVALALNVPVDAAILAIEDVEPEEGRMQPFSTADGITFLRDDWKAPLWSLDSAFAFMRQARSRRKVIVLGTVSDYSLSASKLYPKVAKRAMDVAELVVFVGPHAPRACKAEPGSDRLRGFEDLAQASEFLKLTLRPGDLVLLKGSNKADHLVRLIIDRESPVKCWVYGCGKSEFCRPCAKLHRSGTTHTPVTVVPAAVSELNPDAFGGRTYDRVIVGLGNPGEKYEGTPHNLGYRVLDTIAASWAAQWRDGGICQVAEAGVGDESWLLMKPNVPVNRSGAVVKAVVDKLGVGVGAVTVVHDDMDLVLGRVKVKTGGGDAGHKGVRSVAVAMKSAEFTRLRVGARRAGGCDSAKDLVLNALSESELVVAGEAVAESVRLLSTPSRRKTSQ